MDTIHVQLLSDELLQQIANLNCRYERRVYTHSSTKITRTYFHPHTRHLIVRLKSKYVTNPGGTRTRTDSQKFYYNRPNSSVTTPIPVSFTPRPLRRMRLPPPENVKIID